ncbi:MAG: rhomboid family intramembrane serine protease, partial [Anaerorhabdus sp.]
ITGCIFVFVAQGNVLVVGISGGLYGLMAALLVYGFDSKVIYNPAVARSFISTLLINVMISFLPGVSFFGHMGGFIGGLFIALFITKNKTWKLLKQNALIALAILLVFVGYRATKSFTISPIYYITDLQVLDFMDSVGFKGYSQSMLNKLNKFYGFEIK